MKQEIFAELDSSGNMIHGKNILKKAFEIFKGQRIFITLERQKRKRSIPQNRYLFGVVYDYLQRGFQDQGHDVSKLDVHEFCKHRFLQKEIVNETTGEILTFIRSTTELNKDEMSE